jgi:hypothetical protein
MRLKFHRLYLKIFSSLDFDIEKKLLIELRDEWVVNFLPIKRSWIYALKLSFIALLGIFLMIINAYIWNVYFESIFAKYILPASYIVISLLLLFNTFWYMFYYRKTHKDIWISTDANILIEKNDVVNRNFIKFFNISVLVSCFLIVLLIETLVFLIFFYSGDQILLKLLELWINIFAGFIITKHRRLSMNLELDFSLAVPWKVYIIDQTWLLSSKQSIVAMNIKTVEWVYNSIFGSMLWYWDVKFFLEWNMPDQKWVIRLDYISNPRETVDLINKTL